MQRAIDRDDYDSYEEYEEAKEHQSRRGGKKTGGGKSDSPEPVIFEAAIRRWADGYESVDFPDAETEFWTLGDIRVMLAGMVPFGEGNPMGRISQILEECGIYPTVSRALQGTVYQLRRKSDLIVSIEDIKEQLPAEEGLSLY